MAVVITNALAVNLDPPELQDCSLRIENGLIVQAGSQVDCDPNTETIDAGGAVVLPGLVNGHMHLYSALAVGMPPPKQSPANFQEILERVWWRLDRALDLEACRISALLGAIEAVRSGTTTLIDHHASPSCIAGSLDAIESGLAEIGVRGVLCYEVTDRNGIAGREAGLAENDRYLKKCHAQPDARFAAMAGAHAAFTLADEALAQVADLASLHNVGVHIHVAEDVCDDRICRAQYGRPLMERLDRAGVLALPSILGHGTHLSESDLQRIETTPVGLAHNTRSNMNNAVGYAPLARVRRPIQLGTDGIGSDMFTELQTAWYKTRDARTDFTPADCLRMLANSARAASDRLGVRLGSLKPGSAADIVLTDYLPYTPLTPDNLVGHLIWGLSSRYVDSVMIAGRWVLRKRRFVALDEKAARAAARQSAAAVWSRMATIENTVP